VAGVVLRAGDYEVTFHPDVSMLCASLRHRGDEFIAWPRSLEEFRAGRATAMPLVHPWANRLSAWDYSFDGVHVDLHPGSLPVDGAGLPLHGNIFAVPFDVASLDASGVVARLDYGALSEQSRAFPFPHVVEVDARVDADAGLTIATTIEATATRAVPVSFAWHPFVRLPDVPRSQWELQWPECEHVELDARMIPTGARRRRAAASQSLRGRSFDDHYALGADRRFVLTSSELALALTFHGGYRFAQLYATSRGQFVAVEPMTAEIDALRRGTTPRCGPGTSFTASFTMTVTR
jgi:aldose 1-epimerase